MDTKMQRNPETGGAGQGPQKDHEDPLAGSGHAPPGTHAKVATTVLHVGGMLRATEKSVVEAVLGRRPGVSRVEANPVAQTATVTFDTATTSVAELRRWVEDCGFHCAGQSVPGHICDPLMEPDPADVMHVGHAVAELSHAEPGPAGSAAAAAGWTIRS